MIEKVRWGILSTANIALAKVIPAMQRSPWCEITAIASRDLAKAQQAAAQLNIPHAYGSYEKLLADDSVEAIYNPLPNHLHVPLTLKAASAGKHVLCEKPIAMTAHEAEQLREVSGRVLIAEAFMVRYHPQWQHTRELVRAGEIGEPRIIQVLFSYFNADPTNIRNNPDIGGGSLSDIGCYAVVAGRYFFDADPLRTIALIDQDPAFGVDRLTSAMIDFGAGRQLALTVSTQLVPHQRIQIFGTKGRIEIEVPFNAPPDRTVRIFVDDGSALGGHSARTVEIPAVDQYQLQGEAFSRAIRGTEPLAYSLEDALLNMRTLDALRRSAESAAWERV